MKPFPAVSDADIESCERDGFVCLRNVIPADRLDVLREGVEVDLAEPGPHVEVHTADREPGRFFNDFDLWRHVPGLKGFVFEGPCAALAARLMGSSTVTFFYDHVFVKEPGTESNTHWHRDQPYMAVAGWQFCSNWISLDPISEEISIEFVRGSQRWGRQFAPFDSLTDGTRHPSRVFERCPDIEAARADYDIVCWELQPGATPCSSMR